MTKWMPDLDSRTGPRYLAIADALEGDIAEGRIKAGGRLPTHRDLAWNLGVTVGTVSRAYAEVERRGLVNGEVGRGTYVRGPAPATSFDFDETAGAAAPINLSVSAPPSGGLQGLIGPTLEAIAKDPDAAALLGYQPHAGRPEHRAAGAEWLARRGLQVPPGRVIVTNGANHGVNVALIATTRPGDRILTERLTYAVIQPIAKMFGLRVDPVATDRDGLIPEAVDAACRTGDAKALYCIPTIQNPTTTIMPETRRQAIAEVAQRHDLAILEDDIFALLAESAPPPIVSYAPDRGYYITGLSKTVAPGLRVGYVAGPAQAVDRLAAAVSTTCVMASPLSAEVATRWIREGTADRIVANHRREMAARRDLARKILAAWETDCPQGSLHLWLHLPEPWRSMDFVAEAKLKGVLIAPAEAFAIGRRETPDAVRIGIGLPRDRVSLETGLRILADLLDEGPSQTFGSIV